MTWTKLIDAARLLIVGALTFAGCGYHFAAQGSGLPSNATTIYVANFGNHSRETGLSEQFMRYIKQEIADHKRLQIVDNSSGADLTLSGNVLLENTLPSAFNSVAEPTQYQETLALDAMLRDNRSGKIIWDTHRLTDSGQFSTVEQALITTSPSFLQGKLRAQDIAQLPDLQVAATQQHRVQGQMIQRLARSLYSSMSEGF